MQPCRYTLINEGLPTLSGFSALFNSNDHPPEPLASDIKLLLSGRTKDFQKKVREIEDFEQALQELEKEHDGLQELLQEYEIIRSPVRRLPPDILGEIFSHCIPAHRHPVVSLSEAPLLLTTVCKYWRHIALSSPRLWTRLHIPLLWPTFNGAWNGWGEPPDDWDCRFTRPKLDPTRFEDAESVLRFQERTTRSWLGRAGSCSLAISISYTEFGPGEHLLSPGLLEDGSIRKMLDTLSSFSSTVDHLELTMPLEVCQVFLMNHSSAVLMPRTLKLDLRLVTFSDQDILAPGGIISLLQNPELRSLSIMAKAVNRLTPVTQNLQNLSVHECIRPADAIDILRHCNHLEYCKINLSDATETNAPHFDEEMIFLPNLTNLVLSLGIIQEGIPKLFQRLCCPNLTTFTVQRFSHYSSLHVEESIGIHCVLEKARSLKKLALDAIVTRDTEDLRRCLRSAQQLKHLVLGETFRSSILPNGYASWDPRPPNFSLDILVVQSGAIGTFKYEADGLPNGAMSRGTYEVLLPELEVLEGYGLGLETTDMMVKDFILGRIGNNAIQNDVSPLKQVKLTFARPQDIVVEDEIRRSFEREGAHVMLNLSYIPLSPEVNPPSNDSYTPRLGLGQW